MDEYEELRMVNEHLDDVRWLDEYTDENDGWRLVE